MRTFRSALWLFASVVVLCGVVNAQEPLDGRHRTFNDDLLENLVGEWKITRRIRGQSLENTATVEWVLNHQFMKVHLKDVQKPSQYEAMVFIGYDNMSERYVVHWIDVFGGRSSETLGYGTRNGNSIIPMVHFTTRLPGTRKRRRGSLYWSRRRRLGSGRRSLKMRCGGLEMLYLVLCTLYLVLSS